MKIARRLLIGWTVFCFLPGISHSAAAPQSLSPEDEVRATIVRFQKGVEAGDKAVGESLASQGYFRTGFVDFYNSLADVYSRNKMAFPVEIGHLKILKNGKAKVETYINPGRNLFIFTLARVAGQWKFSHMEGIRFPVYTVPPVPASSIYQIPPDKVKWMMCERDVAFQAEVYDKLKAAVGPEAARAFLVNRGEGFRAAMEAWLPFIEGAAQFALFSGILDENYYGSKYTIVSADEDQAEIRFAPLQELEVMKIAYFTPKMSIEEYQGLYRDIMRARAAACGLDLDASFEGTSCTLKIRKTGTKPS